MYPFSVMCYYKNYSILFTIIKDIPNPDIEIRDPLSICHCEYPKGTWQSQRWNARLLHFVRNDNFLYRDLGKTFPIDKDRILFHTIRD
jgi:hypothetical protein